MEILSRTLRAVSSDNHYGVNTEHFKRCEILEFPVVVVVVGALNYLSSNYFPRIRDGKDARPGWLIIAKELKIPS